MIALTRIKNVSKYFQFECSLSLTVKQKSSSQENRDLVFMQRTHLWPLLITRRAFVIERVSATLKKHTQPNLNMIDESASRCL